MTADDDTAASVMLTNFSEKSRLVKVFLDTGISRDSDILDAATVLLLFFLVGVYIIRSSRRKKGSPPGPFLRIPLLGHLESFFMGSDLVKKSRKLRQKYGDIFSYNVVGVNTVGT